MQYIVFCNKTFSGGGGKGGEVGVGGGEGEGWGERLVWASGETRDGTPVYTHTHADVLLVQYIQYTSMDGM
jgi:hypothetical protein